MALSTAQPSPNYLSSKDVISSQQTDVEAVPGNDTIKDEAPGAEGQGDNDATLQGYKLYAVAIGVYFGALMMSLDIAIIGTVLGDTHSTSQPVTLDGRLL